LRVVARCPVDGVVEAIEGTAPDHYVLGRTMAPGSVVLSVTNFSEAAVFSAS